MTKTPTFLTMALFCAAGTAGCGDEGGALGPGVCSYGGESHRVGERFPDTDGCNTCECGPDGVSCTTMGCPQGDGGPPDTWAPVTCSYGSKTYQVGDTFKDTEDCNTCRCSSDGLVACTVMACIRDAAPPPSDLSATSEAGSRPEDAEAVTCTYNGTVYPVGAFYPATDGCNECHCDGSGRSFCTVVACT